MPSKDMIEETELTQPLPEVTKGVDTDTEATEADMPASSPRSFGCGCAKAPRGKLYAYDWLRDVPDPNGSEMVRVQFKNTRSGFYRNDQHLDLKRGDMVAVEANPGHDIGEVIMTGPLVRLQMRKANLKSDAEIRRVFRIAKPTDLEKYEEAMAREHDTMIRSRKIAEELGLNMKIGDVEYQGDGAKAIFYYIADERVDFRKLIRILADTFHVRIEMKQIGARQEAGRIGGIGPCGRPLCCSSWMTHFSSVGTSAARVQDLSMNPQKLAGQCAKLKCCLNFEVDVYMESSKKMPPKDVALVTKDATYFHFKADTLKREVTYSTDKAIAANLVTISAARAFEIIALNKQGINVEQLDQDASEEKPRREFVDSVGEDSINRFDKSKKKKKRRKSSKPGEGNDIQDASGSPAETDKGKNQRPRKNQGNDRAPQQRRNKNQKQKNNPRPPKGPDSE